MTMGQTATMPMAPVYQGYTFSGINHFKESIVKRTRENFKKVGYEYSMDVISASIGSPSTIDEILQWLYEAGEIALRSFQNVEPYFKEDQTFLTEADINIEAFLVEKIRHKFPTHSIVGEEGAATHNPSDYVWVLDPIDGTTSFVQGLPGWGISVGVLYKGIPYLGFYYMPLLGDVTYTDGQGGVYCNARRLQNTVQATWSPREFIAVNASAHQDFEIDVKRTRALGSIGANLVYTARGSSSAALIPRSYLWDLVAGAAIIHGTGGELRYLSGKPVNYLELLDGRQVTEPIIAAHKNLHPKLRDLIKKRAD